MPGLSIMTDAVELLQGLPIWHGAPRISVLSGGLSNASYRVDDAHGSYIARFGRDFPFHQVSRDRENRASRAAFEASLSPELIHAEPGLMVLRFIEAATYTEADVQNDWQRCVELIRRCHRDMARKITGQGAIFWVFQILREYAATLKAHKHRAEPMLAQWVDITDTLEAAQVPLPIVFGHHDLLAANILNDGQRLWLVDWEYGAFGTAMFDLANLASNNSFSEQLELQMLETYFGKSPDQSLQRAFHAMKVASALREALWGMVSEIYLNVPGVDYVAYANEYTTRFNKTFAAYRQNFGGL